ncbi:cation transporter [Scytonema sp. PRP1]|uniref:cation transporter n=1 Tax=Scytonema sp. PRP1 TaxID=3120513 RepID=UPI003FA7AE8E
MLGTRSGLFLAELIVGLWVHSLSLLAVALVVAALNRHSANPVDSDPNHLEALSALFNSLILLGIAGFIGWEAILRFQDPQVSAGLPILMMAVLGFLVKGINAVLLHDESHHSLNIRGYFFMRSPSVTCRVGPGTRPLYVQTR